jgi:hypothetical protein
MPQPDSVITAAAILEHKADLRTYPYRYLCIHAYRQTGGTGLRQVMAAAEMLSYQGWDLVSIGESSTREIHGIMCRRAWGLSM